MEEEFLQQGGEEEDLSSPKILFNDYLQQIHLLKSRLDDFEDRCKFTSEIIEYFIQCFIALQTEITSFKASLKAQDRKHVYPLLQGIRHILPRLEQAKKERSKVEEMTIKCHDHINSVVNTLEKVLDRFR